MGKHGDENGIFWLTIPKVVADPSAKRGAKGKPRAAKVLRPAGTLPESDWEAPTDYPRLSGVIGFDFETHDPYLKTRGPSWPFSGVGEVVGFSVAWAEGERYYPLAHAGGGNVDRDAALAYLRAVVTDPAVQLVCHNSLYELGWLTRLGIKPANVPYCTQVGAALLDEFRRFKGGYSLNAVGRDYIGVVKDETLLKQAAAALGLDPKNEMWKMPAKFVGPYAEVDAANTLDVWTVMEPQLREEGLWRVFDLECRYTMVVTAQRAHGIRVDLDGAEQLRTSFLKREDELRKQMKDMVGFEAGIWSAAELAKAFKKLGVQTPETEAGADSITKAWLQSVDHPYAKALLEIRKKDKTRGTFIEGYILNLHHNGRIYSQINPLPTDEGGAISGRASSSFPNQQNFPGDRDIEMGRLIRGLLLPDLGARWAASDYSQQEPRLAVHFAELAEIPGARLAGDQYRLNPNMDFHQMVADIAGIGRKQAKILNLALIYGKGEVATCHELGFPTEVVKVRGEEREVAGPEGKAFIELYHAKVPFVNGLKDKVKRVVKRRGWIKTILGRRCRFPEGRKAHAAVNRVVQGSAGDQTKKAQVDMYEQLGEIPLVAVHDEVGNNSYSDAQQDRIVECMVEAVPLTVPVKVDVAYGSNWGECL